MDSKNSELYVMDAATLFYGYSSVLRTCYRTLFGREAVSDFLKLLLSKRCKKQATMNNVCKFAREYQNFAISLNPAIASTGEEAIVCMARWLAGLHERGPSVPRTGRYSLDNMGEAMGVSCPTNHPSVISAVRVTWARPRNIPLLCQLRLLK